MENNIELVTPEHLRLEFCMTKKEVLQDIDNSIRNTIGYGNLYHFEDGEIVGLVRYDIPKSMHDFIKQSYINVGWLSVEFENDADYTRIILKDTSNK